MKQWGITTFAECERGNIVDYKGKMGPVLTRRVITTIGAQLGNVELYLEGAGPIIAPGSTEIEVYR